MDQKIKSKGVSKGALLFLASLIVVTGVCERRGLRDGEKAAVLSVAVRTAELRARPAERMDVEVIVRSTKKFKGLDVQASLFVPTRGAEPLALEMEGQIGDHEATYRGKIVLGEGSPEGFYVLTVEATLGSEKALGKASFLVGKAVADFMIMTAVAEDNPEEDIRAYFEAFRRIGGNMVVIHNIITDKAWFPCRVCQKSAAAGTPEDRVGTALKLAQEYGLSAILSVSWDMSRPIPSSDRLQSMIAIVDELWKLYGSSPALAGFYDYQEGSGTYLAAHLREFARAVKARNGGLLTACAPYIDDPLLAGYLAAIDELDIIIYQGAVMASFRPDNRKCFPLQRTKDCTGLSTGATLQKNKITLSHVELFGYQERRFGNAYLASPEDIRSQILSVATCFGPDGITFFTFHYNMHVLGKTVAEVKHSYRAFEEAMKGYRIIAETAASASSHIGLYLPYSDWWADRWTNCFVPALEAFRRLGICPDIIPFIPPRGEEVLPFYPYHLNEEQLDYLLRHQYVLILTDIAGMQDTDSMLVKEFVSKGGVALFFGPRIPFGDSFVREELCGGREEPISPHDRVIVRESLGQRTKKGEAFSFPAASLSSWTPVDGKILAAFEDGRAAFLQKNFGAGFVVTTPLSLSQAVRIMPDFLRDLFDRALKARGAGRIFDVLGAIEDMDLAMALTDQGRVLAIVNHQRRAVPITIRPLELDPNSLYSLKDWRSGEKPREGRGKEFSEIRVLVPAVDYILLNLSKL
ncbi:MAG: hypothetical protein ACUVV5_12715 [Candidatus Aminicenantales bacterium]